MLDTMARQGEYSDYVRVAGRRSGGPYHLPRKYILSPCVSARFVWLWQHTLCCADCHNHTTT
jgi:hypothetical protein